MTCCAITEIPSMAALAYQRSAGNPPRSRCSAWLFFEPSRRFARMTFRRMPLVLAVQTKGFGMHKKRTGLCGSVLRADALLILTRSVRSQIEPAVGREQGSPTEADSALQGLKQAQIVQLFRKHYTGILTRKFRGIRAQPPHVWRAPTHSPWVRHAALTETHQPRAATLSVLANFRARALTAVKCCALL